jgi:cytochrome P450
VTTECSHILQFILIHSATNQIFGFIVGAHDTTSTTISWGLKFLADNQNPQAKLRRSLRSSFEEAVIEKRLPNIHEIMNVSVPYLDAVIEEILRCANTASGTIRIALTDVEILGHTIPKGTEVFLMSNGPSVRAPAFQIDDSVRSPSYHSSKDRIGDWDPKDVTKFMPERWIAVEDGKEVFDPHAGPTFPFGLGTRGCYGRKLAYVQLRIVLLLMVWNFELQRCPEALSSYDAIDGVTHFPKQCYVRLSKVE